VLIALLCLSSLGVATIAARLRVTLSTEQDYVQQPTEVESAVAKLDEIPTVAEELGL
jgi:hypothetical protein